MRIITKGATDQSVELYIAENTTGLPATGLVFNSPGIDLWYRRPGAVKTSITEVTLAALTTAHADGGFLEIGDGNYRFDLPDAAVATGVDHVAVGGTITGYTVYPVTVQLSAFALQTAIQSVDVRSLPSVWYVATTGNDSNDGKTLATPKLTLTATHTASNPGDTIRIAAGTYSGNFTFSKDNQTWIGVDQNTCVITDPTGATIVVSGNNVSLKNLTINSTGTTTSDVGLAFFGTYGFYGENLTVTGAFDAIQGFNAFYPTLINVNATGKYDAANFGNTSGTYCRNCRFITTADFSPSTDDFRAFHAINGSTDPYATTTFGVLEDCLFLSKRTGSSTAGTGGLHLSGSWHLINPTIYAEVANAATTGRCFGIDDNPQVAHITVVGGSITLSNAGTGATRDAMTTVIGSSIALMGVECIEANFEGNVYNASPTAAKINTAVEAGAVGTNAATAVTQTTAAAQRAALGFASANADVQLSAISANSLTAAAQSTAAKVAAEAVKPVTDTLSLMIDDSNPSEPKYTEPALAEAPTGGGGGGDPVAADIVDDSRTWFATEYRARNIVTVGDNFVGTLAMQPDLNPGTTIVSVSSVSITGAATVTATDLTVNRAKTRVQFTVPALTTTGTYTVIVTIDTIDGQTIPTTATLKVQ